MNTNEIETLSNTITSKQAIDLLDKSLEREEEDKCILKAIDHLERWIGKKVHREFNEEIGFEVTAMKEDTFEVVKAIRFEDSVIYQAPYYVKKYLERGNWIKTDDVTRYVITTYKLERVEHPLIVKCRERKGKYEQRMKEIEKGIEPATQFTRQLEQQRDLIQRLVKESKSNRV
ncbi:hypothetical protein ACW5XW_23900 [Aeromonas piscicola]|uniref:hypothetical protein n=1 Tax=Aeromonas piscicola TaxID=600645 RepID=UPI000AD336FC|nr:hypothetical protein [Aeromonas piscicola]